MDKISEARSHPDKNPRHPPLDELKDLREKHGSDLYVSFTMAFKRNDQRAPAGAKLGVNPKSGFKTPMGIYCYPIDTVIEYSDIQNREAGEYFSHDNGGLDAPFTGYNSWRHAYVFRIDDTNALTPNLSADEYSAAVKKVGHLMDIDPDEMKELIEYAERNANLKGPYGLLWNLTRVAAIELIERRSGKLSAKNDYISIWNGILRKLGFKVAIDPGMGFIHENEDTQAVVLDPSVIKVVSVVNRHEGVERLFYKMRDRLTKNPKLLEQLPTRMVSALPLSMADAIISEYMKEWGSVNKAVEFVLAHEHRDNLIISLCRSDVTVPVGFAAYDKIRSPRIVQGLPHYSVLKFIIETDYKIDTSMVSKVVAGFLNERPDYNKMIDHMLRHPERITNYDSMVKVVARDAGKDMRETYKVVANRARRQLDMELLEHEEAYDGQEEFLKKIRSSDRFQDRCRRAIARVKTALNDMPAGKNRHNEAISMVGNYPVAEDHAYEAISKRIGTIDWDQVDYDEDFAMETANRILDDAIANPVDWDCISGHAFKKLYGL